MSIEIAIGYVIGKLTVVSLDCTIHTRKAAICLCSCGNTTIVPVYSLVSRNTKSCGCGKGAKGRAKKHGMTGSTTYRSWNAMWQRCTNPNCDNYHNYGGRGITVCEEWIDFSVFLSDMGIKPEGYQIDRINNNGNYCKSNCRWVTPKQNANNRRRDV